MTFNNKEYQKRWYQENKEYCKEYSKEYRKRNKDKIEKYYQDNKEYFKKYNKKKYRENKKYYQEVNKKYRELNKEKVKDYSKNWRQENQQKIKNLRKKYYSNNKEERIKKTREYRQNNKEKVIEYKKIYRERNRKKINKFMKEYRKNPRIRININISSSIRTCLKTKKSGRHWETLVGYTIEDLMKHLESKFESWMSWENYGIYEKGKLKWHIDHIIPQSAFKYETAEDLEFKKCWELENLQPLEALENIIKSNKYLNLKKDCGKILK
jgi:hypothetical protein